MDKQADFDLNYVDNIYFWFVTFSTIGFGDITYDVSDWEYSLMVYRLVGLTLLAGIIDSIVVWLKERRKKLKRKFMLKKKEERCFSRRCFGMKWKVTEFKNKAQTYLDSSNFSFNKNAKEAEMLITLITKAGLIWSILQTFLMLQKKIGISTGSLKDIDSTFCKY